MTYLQLVQAATHVSEHRFGQGNGFQALALDLHLTLARYFDRFERTQLCHKLLDVSRIASRVVTDVSCQLQYRVRADCELQRDEINLFW